MTQQPTNRRRPAAPIDPPLRLTPAQLKSQRTRNVAIGLLVGFMVLLFYVMTIAKLGPGVLNRPL